MVHHVPGEIYPLQGIDHAVVLRHPGEMGDHTMLAR
jgi:hypothetical protein